jgi:hypothetical protein
MNEHPHKHEFVWTGTGISIPGADGTAPSLAVFACSICGERISVISDHPMDGSEAGYVNAIEGTLQREPSKPGG